MSGIDDRPQTREAPVRHRVLGIGAEGGILAELDPLLEARHSELYQAPHPRVGLDMIRSLGAVDLVIIQHPLEDSSVRAFLNDLRQASRGPVRLAVLVGQDDIESLDDPDDPDCVSLSLHHPIDELGKILGALLEHAPRVSVNLMVRLEVASDRQKVLRLAQTENISKTGMMLRTADTLPEDARIGFEFYIPDDSHPISGEASIVRYASEEEDIPDGVALRFEHLLGSDQLRLERFLATIATRG